MSPSTSSPTIQVSAGSASSASSAALKYAELGSHVARLFDLLRPRLGGRVGDEPEAVTAVAQPLDRRRGPRDRRTRNVQDAVDVQENGGHGRRVYSLGSRVPFLALKWPGRS